MVVRRHSCGNRKSENIIRVSMMGGLGGDGKTLVKEEKNV